MQVTLTEDGKTDKVALPPEWYSPMVHVLKTKTNCRDGEEALAGYFLDESHLLFFVTSSGRPGYDNVVAVLMNIKAAIQREKSRHLNPCGAAHSNLPKFFFSG